MSQVVYIIRHGDKYSSYPDCEPGEDPVNGSMCFDSEAMGVNPPLTECGVRQANYTAGWIVNQYTGRGIAHIVVSPFARTLMTSLPLARLLGKPITVEPLLSEARQPEGPYRPYNVALPAFAVSQLAEIEEMWDPSYGSPPIKTPEDTPLYDQRVAKMAQALRARFPPASGDLAVFTHATTSFSLAYGLCSNLFASLQEFVDPMPAIAPAGVIVATLDDKGHCTNLTQTQNVAGAVGCGETKPYKCAFKDYPNWYWEDPLGSGPAKCH